MFWQPTPPSFRGGAPETIRDRSSYGGGVILSLIFPHYKHLSFWLLLLLLLWFVVVFCGTRVRPGVVRLVLLLGSGVRVFSGRM